MQNFVNSFLFSSGDFFQTKKPLLDLKNLFGHYENIIQFNSNNSSSKITLTGFRGFKVPELAKTLNKNLHTTEKLGLYSLNINFQIIDNDEIQINQKIQKTEYITTTILSYIEELTFSPDRMKFNDHVVSARLEALIFTKAFFKDNNYQNSTVLSQIDKHIALCVLELTDNRKFTWRTNHGLMQIRALLSFDYAMEENKYSEKVRNVIADRIAEELLLDFHIAEDGSVYEAASGYWRYVYSQWGKISSFPRLKTDSILSSRLLNTLQFLNTVTTSDGFVQGFGDSYNYFQQDYSRPANFASNYFYLFGNGLAGVNLGDTPHPIHIYFTALDNPPYVKKHPEDLSFYIYYNQPFFINPGTYAWDNSRERRHVQSQVVQNTLYSSIFSEPDSSIIYKLNTFSDSLVVFSGEKWNKGKSLKRDIYFNILNGTININDTGDNDELITGYNIHPLVSVSRINDKQLILNGEKTSIKISSNTPIKIETVKISDSYNSLLDVERLLMMNDTISYKIELQNYSSPLEELKLLINSSKSRQRNVIASKLSSKYWKANFYKAPSFKRLIAPRVGLLVVIILLTLFTKPNSTFNHYALICYVFICCIDILLSGMLLSLKFL